MTPSPDISAATSAAIHIALAANHRYIKGLKVTMVSMIKATRNKSGLRFHVFSDGMLDTDRDEVLDLIRKVGYKEKVDFRKANMDQMAAAFSPYRGGRTAYLRLYLTDLLPDQDWVLWTDVDTLWFRDPADLFAEKEEDYSLVWARDMVDSRTRASKEFAKWHPGYDAGKYACSGIVLMNLKKLREMELVKRCLAFEKMWGTPPHPDQDMLNSICSDSVKMVDDRWGCMVPDRHASGGVVLHCVGMGPRFNATDYRPWLPANEVWIRYYREVIEGVTCGGSPCTLLQRFVFNVLGLVYPSLWIASILSLPARHYMTRYNVWRTMYLCWLRRKIKW